MTCHPSSRCEPPDLYDALNQARSALIIDALATAGAVRSHRPDREVAQFLVDQVVSAAAYTEALTRAHEEES